MCLLKMLLCKLIVNKKKQVDINLYARMFAYIGARLLEKFTISINNAGSLEHTAGSDTVFVQIYMDVLPGVPGVS